MVAHSGFEGEEARLQIERLLPIAMSGQSAMSDDYARAHKALRANCRRERTERRADGLPRYPSYLINTATWRAVDDEEFEAAEIAKARAEHADSAIKTAVRNIARLKDAPFDQVLIEAFVAGFQTRNCPIDVEVMVADIAAASDKLDIAIVAKAIEAGRGSADGAEAELAFSRFLTRQRLAAPAVSAPAEHVEALAETVATSAHVEAPAAPVALSDDSEAERRAVGRVVAAVKAVRGRSLDELLAVVRRQAGEAVAIPNNKLADVMIATSEELSDYTHDAIRFSVDEARRAGAGYNDATVAVRVEMMLKGVHAPVTGQPGLAERNAALAAAAMSPSGAIGPTPFKWVDPDTLPLREWLYGTALIRREITATIAPGGGLKTSLGIAEALALASGKPLLGVQPEKRCKVWIWNGEEPMDEMQRRIMAACRYYELASGDIDGWLFVDTIDTSDFVIASEEAKGVRINEPRVAILTRWVCENAIDVLMIDPFISTHNVEESSNKAIQQVATAWKDVARGGNCAISLAHHIRKTNGQATTVEDSRGAKSLTDKARIVRPIALMTKEDADKFGVPVDERRRYVSIDPTEIKGNMSLGAGGRDWYQSVSVTVGKRVGNLDKGDAVGVVARWWPSEKRVELDEEQITALGVEMGDKAWRAANNTMHRPDMIGAPICKAFGLDQASPRDRAKAWKLYLRLVEDGILSPVAVTAGYKTFPGARFCNPST